MANLVYPNRPPVPGSMSYTDPDQPTGSIDYLSIRRLALKKQSEKPKGFFYNTAGGKMDNVTPNGTVVYLACPNGISAQYTASYNKVAFGTVGMAAGEALANGKTFGSAEASAILQKMGGAAMPEMVMSSITDVTRGLGNLMGSEFGGDKNSLLAVSQGKIFNPYEEILFNGTGFRTFSFQFKLVARNDGEATTIGEIVKYLKEGMLPHMGGDASPNAGGKPAKGRYIYVPDKFELKFMRLIPNGAELQEIPHIKFMQCVMEAFDVQYTPDGSYTALKSADSTPNKLKVPAVTLNMQFKETAYITKELATQGY